MRATVAILNLALGAVYTGYGIITAIEMKRGWKTFGFSHFGAAWIAMAFTCGPHHLAHGYHVAFAGRSGGLLDVVAVVAGLPAGAAFIWLRVEAFLGGRGDRFIPGTPAWLLSVPVVAGMYVTALVAAAIAVGRGGLMFTSTSVPNVLLFGIYMMIGYFLLRTQLRNREPMGGWSLSGTSLTAVFPTCALMHAVWILYAAVGVYHFDVRGFTIDWLGVPAGLYFLFVVRALYRQSVRDWNREMVDADHSLATVG